ncbi:MAG: hypothetical protein WCT08_01805 [Patescibacteria group bacterium]|jgi:hypothetical protein
MTAKSITKADFNKGLQGIRSAIVRVATDIKKTNIKVDNLRLELKDDIRQVISHFNKSQGEQNRRLDSIDTRLDAFDIRFDSVDTRLEAIMSMLATRKEMHNLVRELKNQGINLEEARIFV